MRAWLTRTAELQRELAAIAEVDPRWWLLAGAAALAEPRAAPAKVYLACDAEPDADTFMGYPSPPPRDLIRDAIARARAARTALRELDGTLPEQPLAVTVERAAGAKPRPSTLSVAAFAIADRCLTADLEDPDLGHKLAATLAGAAPPRWRGEPPFVCVALGEEPLETARHGHRRAWTEHGGPWLGLGRAAGLALVSTCHLIVDGYGHARITARIAELTAPDARDAPDSRDAHDAPGARDAPDSRDARATPGARDAAQRTSAQGIPAAALADALALAPVAGAVPLVIAWRALPRPAPRLVPLAYRLGRILHRHAGRPIAAFSPTIQIPVARGSKD
ncbi:MAG TPA: hypothetical protein PKU97_05255, partial [Kofleriaceae bacterium]|nr:hypothetical protein [Kofleriaceae bacterium]